MEKQILDISQLGYCNSLFITSKVPIIQYATHLFKSDFEAILYTTDLLLEKIPTNIFAIIEDGKITGFVSDTILFQCTDAQYVVQVVYEKQYDERFAVVLDTFNAKILYVSNPIRKDVDNEFIKKITSDAIMGAYNFVKNLGNFTLADATLPIMTIIDNELKDTD